MQLDVHNKPRVAAALDIAMGAHRGQTRKYTGEPYHTHPIAVAEKLLSHGLVSEDVLCSALLHDVLEDTDYPASKIEGKCGARVLRWVQMLTDTEQGNRATRKALALRRLATAPAEVQSIKLADIIHNTRSIVAHDPAFARIYLPEKKALIEALKLGKASLRDEAYGLYVSGTNTLAEQELAMGLAHQAQLKADEDLIAAIIDEEALLDMREFALF